MTQRRSRFSVIAMMAAVFVVAMTALGCSRSSELITPIDPVVVVDTLDIISMEFSMSGIHFERYQKRVKDLTPLPDTSWTALLSIIDTLSACGDTSAWRASAGNEYSYLCRRDSPPRVYESSSIRRTARFTIDTTRRMFTALSYDTVSHYLYQWMGGAFGHHIHKAVLLRDLPYEVDPDGALSVRIGGREITSHVVAVADTVVSSGGSNSSQGAWHSDTTTSRQIVSVDSDAHIAVRLRVR